MTSRGQAEKPQPAKANHPASSTPTVPCECDISWCPGFLEYLAETSNVSASAAHVGEHTSTVYRHRRQNPEFAREWLAALREGYTHLEMEVLRRMRDGDQRALADEKYDFANAIRLLNAHRENAARAEADQRNVSAAEVRASIDRKVEAIRLQLQREREAKKQGSAKKV
ncbi:MAG: hypothetical protein AAF127_04305 [Pseudomonadota bacterium]